MGETGSSYILSTPPHLAITVQHISILNTAPHVAIPLHRISEARPLIWRFRLTIFFKHAPSFGDSGSSYMLKTPPHLAMTVHLLS